MSGSDLRLLRRPLMLLWVGVVVVLLFHLDSLLHTFSWTTRHSNALQGQVNLHIHDVVKGEVKLEVKLAHEQRGNDTLSKMAERLAAGLAKKSVKVPDISDVLTHLKNKPSIFEPAFKMSKNRENVSVVIGIPHVNRKVAFYLNDTLKSLVGNLKPSDAQDCLIIVLFCDLDHQYNMKAVHDTARAFPDAVNSGLLELVVSPPSFYPDLEKLALVTERNGDSIERWKWRSRENLDAAFLMNYAYRKGRFYLMSEDDVTTVPDYFPQVKQFAEKPPRQNWFIMGFSEYGSKGILFRSGDCPMLVNFILNFYGAWPVDWLLDDFLVVWGCTKDTDPSCGSQKNTLRLDYGRHLFIHIGFHSSLKGKIMNDAKKP